MKMQGKRIAALALCILLVFGLLPVTANAATAVTVTIKDEDGNAVTGASIRVTAKRGNTSLSLSPTIREGNNGAYTVSYGRNIQSNYTVTLEVSAPGYETGSVQIKGNTTSTRITLVKDEPVETEPEETEPEVTEPEVTEAPTETVPTIRWEEFKMYYYIKGTEDDPFPPTYAGSSAEGNFGPSGDNTPFVTVRVNFDKLRAEYPDVAVYQENTNSNDWHFIPGTTAPNLEDAKVFWSAVLDCMDEESLQALEATGLSKWFIGYVAKKMGNGGESHIDGILKVTPPVHSIELYLNEVTSSDHANYVGGLIKNEYDPFHTMSDVLTALEGYLGHTITWNEDENGNPIATDGVYTGTYIENNVEYTISVKQSDRESSLVSFEGSEIRYVKKSDYYFVACFVLTIEEEQLMEYTVTYTDGEADGAAFYDHTYGVVKTGKDDPAVPVFPYEAIHQNHLFLGWILEGGDGTLLSNADIEQMRVTRDMVFHAQWASLFQVQFHPNNTAAEGNQDVFRTYYSHESMVTEGGYLLNAGKVDVFYDIPTFAYDVHNGYIFKGWYMGTEEGAAPMDWNATYTEETHIYAHWIYVGEVAKEDDGKIYESSAYPEYDLLGNQIRVATENPNLHYGDPSPGLRFIASLSERVYQEMKQIHAENNDGIEYGFVIAAANAAQAKADGEGYMLKYKHATLNGEDTTSTYSYVNNIPCRVPDVPVDDHFDGEQYRLYTAVITYKNLEGDRLTQAQNTYFIGRAYLRYFDANGLERVHYNNYTGDSKTYGGVNTCYTQVNALLNEM